MKRLFIFKSVKFGEELVLPVTPAGYEVEAGRKVEPLDMQEAGTLNLPGLKTLLDKGIQCMFPAQAYPFVNAGATYNPWYYVKKFRNWSESAEVLRFVISDTEVNEPVLVESITYGEQDGTGDVYATIQLKGYRDVTAPQLERTAVDDASKNAPRAPAEAQEEPQQTYVVVKGDSLWSICKKFYGDGSLAYRLAAYNNIANANLIYPGQVLKIPPLSELQDTAPAAVPKSPQVKAAEQAQEAAAQTGTGAGTVGGITNAKTVKCRVIVGFGGDSGGTVTLTVKDSAGKTVTTKTFTSSGALSVDKGNLVTATWNRDRNYWLRKATYDNYDITDCASKCFTANKDHTLNFTWAINAAGLWNAFTEGLIGGLSK